MIARPARLLPIVASIAAVLLACGNEASREDSVRVERITDGDTIVVRSSSGAERVRLLGIDAPEMNYGKGRPECGAREATLALRERIDGRRVVLRRFGEDDYGRTLAIVLEPVSAEVSVNEWLLREGHAELFRKGRHPYRERFVRAEREAKRERRGMWRCPSDRG
ncbi:MAG TPA: thermonuclease family protein [Thermoanaerobaculia bacterium]|nr:thermonuclease family protein [Thermoanaerobaculia bacterium]